MSIQHIKRGPGPHIGLLGNSIKSNFVRFNLGLVLWRGAGDPDRVDRELDAAVSLQPDDGPLLFRVARIRAGQERTEEALDLLSRALQASPELADMARREEAFVPLRENPRFRQLVLSGAGSGPSP